MKREGDMQTNRCKDIQTRTDKQIKWQVHRWRDRDTDRQTDSLGDEDLDIQILANKHRDRREDNYVCQTDKENRQRGR